MCSNTFVSELKETFTSTHTYLMNTLLSMSVVGASKSCGNHSAMSNWLAHNGFMAIANLFSARQVSIWHFNFILQVNSMQMKIN